MNVNECCVVKLTLAKVFHFSSKSFAIIPPSSMFKCSGFVPAKIIIIAELQSEKREIKKMLKYIADEYLLVLLFNSFGHQTPIYH